jgi:hypothetical protein
LFLCRSLFAFVERRRFCCCWTPPWAWGTSFCFNMETPTFLDAAFATWGWVALPQPGIPWGAFVQAAQLAVLESTAHLQGHREEPSYCYQAQRRCDWQNGIRPMGH